MQRTVLVMSGGLLYILNILRLNVRKGVFKTLFQAFLTQPPFVIVSMQFNHLTAIHFNTALRRQEELKAACGFGL